MLGQWKQLFNTTPKRRPALGRRRFLPAVEMLEVRTVPTVYTVNTLADNNSGSGDTGSLRYCITQANADSSKSSSNPDTINFADITLSKTTPNVIHISAGNGALPSIGANIIIDATTAVGYFTNSKNTTPSNLMVDVDGSSLSSGNGLVLAGGNSTVRGLEITGFPGDGILVTSTGNTIGGEQVGLNSAGQANNPAGRITDPVSAHGSVTMVDVRPPQGNVISGNGGDGVLIQDAVGTSTVLNLLAGNFIGTTVTGLVADPNGGDGVDVEGSSYVDLLGTIAPDGGNPFIFYNVISGNTGNGLIVNNSDNTTIYANFFGIGADDATAVGNRQDGVLIEGDSDLTNFGGNIPLGNVVAANGGNGVVVAGTATRTILGNTFDGVAAFNPKVTVGNGEDGILITSPGDGATFIDQPELNVPAGITTLVLTNQVSDNGADGIEIGGDATAVQVAQSLIGLDTNGRSTQPNTANGIEIDGDAHGILIGGFEPSVEGNAGSDSIVLATNVVSGNKLNGILIDGSAYDNTIINTFVGTDITGAAGAANGQNGIDLVNSSDNQIGAPLGSSASVLAKDRNIIAFNTLDGVRVQGGSNNSILGSTIFSNQHLGIDLVSGGNNNQSAPTLSTGLLGSFSAGSVITGTLIGQPSTTYHIEIFASQSTTAGNGQFFLGDEEVTTDSSGVVHFTLQELGTPSLASAFYVTGTATDPLGNTSQFSRPIAANHNGRYH
jgi:hypothetical protein